MQDYVTQANRVIARRRRIRSYLRLLLHPYYMLKRRISGSRIVIHERRGMFYASFQGKVLFFWREIHRSEVFNSFPALLLDLSERQNEILNAQGKRISRQARRAFARRVASRI